MEYRRNRRTRNSRKGESGSGGKALALIILLAAAVYFVSVSAVGSWLSAHIVEPFFSAFRADSSQKHDESTDIFTVNTAGEVELPKLECYFLQMGVFSTKDNAEELAKSLQSKGGGGYVYDDDGKYRVFAAGYQTEADARSVKDRLISEGMDCSVHTFITQDTKYDVSTASGTGNTVSALQTAFYAFLSAHDDLLELEKNFDSNNMTIEQGADSVQSIYDTFTGSIKDKKSLPKEVTACVDNCTKLLSELCKAKNISHAEFSSKLKYAQIAFACEFMNAVKLLSGK